MKKVNTGILIILGIGLLVWINYALFTGQLIGLPPEVDAALQSDEEVEVTLLEDDSWMVMTPSKTEPTTGLIMYPEGQREIRSYAPISRLITQQGFQVLFLSRRLEGDYDIVEEQRRIEAVMATYPQIETWVLGGHSWGGEMGADYAAAHLERVAGLVLWAGRIDDTTGLRSSELPVLMVYGTLDNENVNLVTSTKPFLPEQTIWVTIEGGNRAQFGNYGPMAADVGATISSEEQQIQAADATIEFLNDLP